MYFVVFLTGEKNLKLSSFPIRIFLNLEKGGLSSNDVIRCRSVMTLSFFDHVPQQGRPQYIRFGEKMDNQAPEMALVDF